MLHLTFNHPRWLADFRLAVAGRRLVTPEAQVQLANELARLNVEAQTGGPFGAAIINNETGLVAGLGVNSVLSNGSMFHAEVCAIWDAQYRLGTYDLAGSGLPPFTLAVSAAPCAMCSGALVWSGIKGLVTGATTADIERLAGFDEGPIAHDLQSALERRGISWQSEILREECCEVLECYRLSGGVVYNPARGAAAKAA